MKARSCESPRDMTRGSGVDRHVRPSGSGTKATVHESEMNAAYLFVTLPVKSQTRLYPIQPRHDLVLARRSACHSRGGGESKSVSGQMSHGTVTVDKIM